MPLKILCLGDIVGKPGRLVVAELLPKLVADRGIDLVIANAENSAGGSGLTPANFTKLLSYGIHVCTLGDHAYRKKDIFPILEQSDRLIRPGNFPPSAIGRGWTVATTAAGVRVAILQIMGRTHISVPADDPFRAIDRMLGELPRDIKVRVVDFHAEVTSEKIAMGWYVNGRVSVLFGTHTHTPTADARILPSDTALSGGPGGRGGGNGGGTAYVSDVGMTGPYDSVLGRRKDRVLKHLLSGMPAFFEVATGDPRLCGVIATVDETTGLALAIERCDLKGTEQAAAYEAEDGRGQSGDM